MKVLFFLLILTLSPSIYARSYVIFSMAQDLSMGVENEVLKKNYYVNMGSRQGIKKVSVLDVFRVISIQNPYDNKKRVNYKVKVGTLKVIHASEQASIASLNEYVEERPVLELDQFMIGDHVAVSVD